MTQESAAQNFSSFIAGRKFKTILADPPWQFQNRTGKVAPEHKRLNRYGTLTLDDIKALPVAEAAADTAHLYLWVPNALLPEGLSVMQAWGFQYKSNIIWQKIRKDGGPDEVRDRLYHRQRRPRGAQGRSYGEGLTAGALQPRQTAQTRLPAAAREICGISRVPLAIQRG